MKKASIKELQSDSRNLPVHR